MLAMPWVCPQRLFFFFQKVFKGGRIEEDLGLVESHLGPFYHFWAPSPISVLALLWRTPRGGRQLSVYTVESLKCLGACPPLEQVCESSLASPGPFRVPCGIR